MKRSLILLLTSIIPAVILAHFQTEPGMPVHIQGDTLLQYTPYPNGDVVPDYSWCGYQLSSVGIPFVPAQVQVSAPADGADATALIQQALDYVGSLPVGPDGFRGAVVLRQGRYHLDGQLLMRQSGVVLRGEGNGVVLEAHGTDKNELIRVFGFDNYTPVDSATPITAPYVPVGTRFIPLSSTAQYQAGDRISIVRPCTEEWIHRLGTDQIGHQQEYNFSRWKPGQYQMRIDRTVVQVRSDGLLIDAPLTISLDASYGPSTVQRYTWTGRIHHVGIENICCESRYQVGKLKDENHRWQAVTINDAEDCWVRRLRTHWFTGSAVMLLEGASRITVEDCVFNEPVGEEANHRRYAFHTCGQLTLFQRCYARYGYHSFSVGRGVPGPNAFVQCYEEESLSFSGSTGGFSNGILFDRCTLSGGVLNYGYRDIADKGSAWVAANSMCWATRASQTHIVTPPDAHNWGYGLWTQPFGDGYYQCSHTFVRPESMFYAQLKARSTNDDTQLRHALHEDACIYRYPTDETARATVEYASLMSQLQREEDDYHMAEWSEQLAARYPLVDDLHGVPDIHDVRMPKAWLQRQQARQQYLAHRAPKLEVSNGRLVRGALLLTNGTRPGTQAPSVNGWQGQGSLTHFYPGHTGRGYTEEPDTLAMLLLKSGAKTFSHHNGLWYDCRRNDHERNRHADAECWAPFNEYPWDRCGQGEAQDRLSRYDLTTFNPWYFARLRRFVEAADREGLALIHEHYFQHNIIEEGAHWCDYPWRAANNVNNAGLQFPERQLFAGDKRVYMAQAFYDVEGNQAVRDFQRMYIQQSVSTMQGLNGAIHHLGIEYTGPLHFTRFWLQTINAMPQHQLVSLTGCKDVMDSLLHDPVTQGMVDVIDIRQWHYYADEEGRTQLYSPEGGKSLAPRQWARILADGTVLPQHVWQAVRQYRQLYPTKAVTYNASRPRAAAGATAQQRSLAALQQRECDWLILLAGGSLPAVPPVDAIPQLYNLASQLQTLDHLSGPAMANADGTTQYAMGQAGTGYIVYCEGTQLRLTVPTDRTRYRLYWIDPANGAVIGTATSVTPSQSLQLTAPRPHVVAVLMKK